MRSVYSAAMVRASRESTWPFATDGLPCVPAPRSRSSSGAPLAIENGPARLRVDGWEGRDRAAPSLPLRDVRRAHESDLLNG